MPRIIFIHTNNKQLLGAKLGKFSIERTLPKDTDIEVRYINVDELSIFKGFAGKTYLFAGKDRTYNPADLQSFTLSRFMPPELMGYEGRSIVIDPDIFAIRDITPIMDMDLEGKPVAACPKKDAWDTSVMVMDNAQLKHWRMTDFLKALENKMTDYADIISLSFEPEVKELSREWNSLDALDIHTKLLHTTNRLTQPWRTGLPVDFTPNKMPKMFGIIPREPIHKLLGKYPTRYLPHPDKRIELWFLKLVSDAVKAGTISRSEIEKEIALGHLRKDMLQKI